MENNNINKMIENKIINDRLDEIETQLEVDLKENEVVMNKMIMIRDLQLKEEIEELEPTIINRLENLQEINRELRELITQATIKRNFEVMKRCNLLYDKTLKQVMEFYNIIN